MPPIVTFIDAERRTVYLDVTRIESAAVLAATDSRSGATLEIVMQSGRLHRRAFPAKPADSDVTYSTQECVYQAKSFAGELLRFDPFINPDDPSFPF